MCSRQKSPYTIFRPETLPVPALEAPPLEPLPLPVATGLPAPEDVTGTPSTVVPGTGGGFTDNPTGLTTTAGLPTVCTTGATAIRAGVMSNPWGLHIQWNACQLLQLTTGVLPRWQQALMRWPAEIFGRECTGATSDENDSDLKLLPTRHLLQGHRQSSWSGLGRWRLGQLYSQG